MVYLSRVLVKEETEISLESPGSMYVGSKTDDISRKLTRRTSGELKEVGEQKV